MIRSLLVLLIFSMPLVLNAKFEQETNESPIGPPKLAEIKQFVRNMTKDQLIEKLFGSIQPPKLPKLDSDKNLFEIFDKAKTIIYKNTLKVDIMFIWLIIITILVLLLFVLKCVRCKCCRSFKYKEVNTNEPNKS